mmetsp:Transcript_29806/g.62687  ORF Transcript_29806/g.62687 Transcript_29806/m.62687 type:complete len:419 (+) Transcript_29806:100-1356(+)
MKLCPLASPETFKAKETSIGSEVESEKSGSLFDALPIEVNRSILSFMDIPSLSALSMTQHREQGNIAYLASDNVTWMTLVQRRFGIGCNDRGRSLATKHKQGGQAVQVVRRVSPLSSGETTIRKLRPMSYGGATWKDAYRVQSLTSRIPETCITSGGTSGAAVFASPNNRHKRREKRGEAKCKSPADYLGVWCMVQHAENCRTKTVNGFGRQNNSSCLPYSEHRRYLELKLCLQNTKSGFGILAVPDLSLICLKSVDEELNAYCGSENHRKTFQIVTHGPWKPKIILRRRFCEETLKHSSNSVTDSGSMNWLNDDSFNDMADDIMLRPFEVVVLAIRVSCPSDMVYETDFLSTASSLHVPVISREWNQANGTKCKDFEKIAADFATARFIEEDEVWEYYSQLPGGCLSLTDRSRLVPM